MEEAERGGQEPAEEGESSASDEIAYAVADLLRSQQLLDALKGWVAARLSLVSPTREVYIIEISPNRIRASRSASILISSLKPMPSDSNFMCSRMERRKTHMPDCESRTQRKKSSDMARERPRLPISLIRLIPRRSRTGNRDALRKSTPR